MLKRLIYGLTGLVTAVALTLTSGTAAMAATTSTVSEDWAGYQARATDAHYASAQLVQPKITCASGDSSSTALFWVGVGGSMVWGGFLPGGKTLSQVGTYAFCYNGKARYFLWWETVGRSASEGGGALQPVWQTAAPGVCRSMPPYTGTRLLAYWVDQKCTAPVAPGDRVNLSAVVSAGKWANLVAYDFTTRSQLNTTQTFTGAEADAANWVVEAPRDPVSSSSTLPLANFGQVTFLNCQVVSNSTFLPISALSNTVLYLINDWLRYVRASPTALMANGTQFSVTWQHS